SVRNSFPVPAEASLWLDATQVQIQLAAHEGILAALESGDAEAAEHIMIDHVRRAGAYRRHT
ncbi:FCD domain-containing protein, partial [Nonomuraea insulae]